MRLKVCGMTMPEQVNALDAMGIEFAGFIFYAKSPRYMGDKITAEMMKKISGHIAKVGVFVNMEYEELMRTIDHYRLDAVQLHGDESPVFCEKVANYVTVIKAFRISDNDPLDWMIRSYAESTDMLLFDTLGSGYGGTGKKFNWSVLKNVNIDKLYFLSGGIEEGDVEELQHFTKTPESAKLFAIDINSKFETEPGVKDIEKIKLFLKEINS